MKPCINMALAPYAAEQNPKISVVQLVFITTIYPEETVFVLESGWSTKAKSPGNDHVFELALTKVLTQQGRCGWVQSKLLRAADEIGEQEDDGREGC